MIPELHTNLVDRIGKYTHLRKIAAHEWAGPCIRCGGRDRFRVSDQKGWFCRECTGEPGSTGKWNDYADFTSIMLHWTLAQTLQSIGANRKLSPAEITALDAERKTRQEQERKAEQQTQAQVHQRLTDCRDWREYAGYMQAPEYRALWHKRGLSDNWIDYYALGYCPNRTWNGPDGTFESDSLTIPYFRPAFKRIDDHEEFDHWHVIGLQHRLLTPNAPGGKYRPHLAGAGKHLFYADIYQRGPTAYDLLIVEGEIKAIITETALWVDQDKIAPNLSVVGVPGKGWREEWVTEFQQSPRVTICLDPDAADSAKRLAQMIGPQAQVILLPDKIDDLINIQVLDGWKLLQLLER
jgi:hypothetical protein